MATWQAQASERLLALPYQLVPLFPTGKSGSNPHTTSVYRLDRAMSIWETAERIASIDEHIFEHSLFVWIGRVRSWNSCIHWTEL